MGAGETRDVKNIWFHIDMAEGLRRHLLSCCAASKARVSVRLDKREVYCTAPQSSSSRSSIWQETCIVPSQGESLLEFVVTVQGKFSGSAVVALSSCTLFDGALELRALDKPAGHLQVKVGWQNVTSSAAAGEDLLRACWSSSRHRNPLLAGPLL